MVGKGSPRLNMIGRVSPKLDRFLGTTSAIKKKSGGSPKGRKDRASWTPELEKSLVEILLEHKDTGARGDNGCWSSEGWTRMIKEFHARNKYVNFSRSQIQEKEGQLKRDYKMLKEARRQSGASWNERRCMVEGSSSMWDNLEVTYPKIKKFRSNKASFPLFDSLGELYDGHLAEGNYNCTSLGEQEQPLRQVGMEDDVQELDDMIIVDQNGDKEELLAPREQEVQGSSAARLQQGKRKNDELEETRPKKSTRIENILEKYVDMRLKQTEIENAQLVKENEATQGVDFSVKKCISVLSSMEVTREEKAKAYAVFKTPENREIFLCAFEDDPEAALIWLRSEMA